MDSWAPLLTMMLQAVIAAVLAVFTSSLQRNRATLERIAAEITAISVGMAKLAVAQDGYEKRFEQHARDVERRLGMLEEHMLLTRGSPGRQ